MQDKSLKRDDPVDLFDKQGSTFAILVSRFEEAGWIMVGTSYLVPRAGDTIMMEGEGKGWAEIYRGEGGIAVGF